MPSCILVINPGSTSTKIAVFEETARLFDKSVSHSSDEIKKYPSIAAQYEFRHEAIMDALKAQGFDMKRLAAVVGRGGCCIRFPAVSTVSTRP